MPHARSTSAAPAAAVADGVGQRATHSSQIGATRATGVCCNMNSLTRICQAVTVGHAPRQVAAGAAIPVDELGGEMVTDVPVIGGSAE